MVLKPQMQANGKLKFNMITVPYENIHGDIPLAINENVNAYLATPKDQFKYFSVKENRIYDYGDL